MITRVAALIDRRALMALLLVRAMDARVHDARRATAAARTNAHHPVPRESSLLVVAHRVVVAPCAVWRAQTFETARATVGRSVGRSSSIVIIGHT